jgi:outer membrane protein OmpA-like peptidoglycan-associated protein
MPRIPTVIAGVATGAVLAVALTACGGVDEAACDRSAPHDIGLVAGALATQPHGALPAEVADLLTKAATSNGDITIVVPSGTPEVMGTVSLGSKANDASVCASQQHANVEAVSGYAEALVPTSEEADFLGAIAAASRGLRPSPLGIVVVGSGLQSVDPMNFALGQLLYADPGAVAADLAERGLLPDLGGATVYWFGMGDTASEAQSPLTVSARRNLEAVWSAVIAAAQGELVLAGRPLAGDAPSGSPAVTPVPVRPEPTKDDWAKPIVLRDSDLSFRFDTAEFLHPERAAAVLTAVAGSIVANGEVVTVTGVTSRDGATDNAADLRLGLLRADRVIAELVALGVPRALLKADSRGHEWCGFVEETSPAVASANRKVILTSPGVPLC